MATQKGVVLTSLQNKHINRDREVKIDKVVVRQRGGGWGGPGQTITRLIETQVCVSHACASCKTRRIQGRTSAKGDRTRQVIRGWYMWRDGRGGRDMVKACSKFGGRRASVRDTRLNKVVRDTRLNWQNKKKEQKRSAFSFYFFFWKNVYTSPRTLDPSH